MAYTNTIRYFAPVAAPPQKAVLTVVDATFRSLGLPDYVTFFLLSSTEARCKANRTPAGCMGTPIVRPPQSGQRNVLRAWG